MALRTGFYYDPIFLQHDTGQHPENAGRLEFLVRSMAQNVELQGLEACPVRPAVPEELALIHPTDYIQYVREGCAAGVNFLGTMDCVVSPKTYEVALHAAGAVLDAVERVATGKLDNAFCAVRPPGHHAEVSEALGFCYFNNVAVAAEYLVKHKGFQRVLIFDFDVHHGNGTQHIFEERADVFYASIHQDPRTCYPGTGFASERGFGEGKGYTLNCPMPPYSDDDAYEAAFARMILPVFQEYRPDFVLLSAGFDAHRDDPLAQQNLTLHAFNEILEGMKQLAFQYAKGHLVSVLEGGYNYQALAECVEAHLQLLQEEPL